MSLSRGVTLSILKGLFPLEKKVDPLPITCIQENLRKQSDIKVNKGVI